ncbi:MAG: hypothetical protein SF162_16840 [bacterium]|nr:hypothetical protein [bacterium]
MKELVLTIDRVRRISDTHQHVHLSFEPSLINLRAGHSLLARVGDPVEPYLREHWHPVAVNRQEVIVERPAAFLYMPGTPVTVLSMIGQPFRYRRNLRSVLFMACDTAPTPLLLALPALIANHVAVTLVLIGKAAAYKTEHLPPEVEVIAGDADFNWHNRVTTVGWADQVFVVVDPADEIAYYRRVWALFTELRAEIPKGYLFGVFQPPLPCGVGACGACMIRLKGGQGLACAQGPAFDLQEMALS